MTAIDPNRAFSISEAAKDHPKGIFLRTSTEEISYETAAMRTAALLKTLAKPAPGRPFLLKASATPETVLTIAACLEAHIPMVLVHPELTESEIKALREAIARQKTPLPSDAAVVIFTSGTTGRPKGAVLTHANLEASARSSSANIRLCPEDVWLLSISPARIGGFSIITRTIRARSTIALGGKFKAETFFDELAAVGATFASIVPTMLVRILDADARPAVPAALRAVLLGGASATPALLERAKSAGLPVMATYGMTETASNVTTTPYAERYAGTVGSGRTNAGAEVKIENGRILVRGPMRMYGYWGEKPLAPDAWFDTGDLGRWDAAGNLHVEARRSDLILTGGSNVYPLEVEAALEQIDGVREALVVGLPDDVWGAVVTALLVPEQTPIADDELVRGLTQRLSPHKRPRRIVWVEKLPTTAGGKLRRQPETLAWLQLRTLHYRGR